MIDQIAPNINELSRNLRCLCYMIILLAFENKCNKTEQLCLEPVIENSSVKHRGQKGVQSWPLHLF